MTPRGARSPHGVRQRSGAQSAKKKKNTQAAAAARPPARAALRG